ncbi:hypothetical protein IMZ48_17865 [Candidatus Bathyarchaeota archaeon]|nr:hypothetical protein [Candidatus Bathyarchaeota archaeon]
MATTDSVAPTLDNGVVAVDEKKDASKGSDLESSSAGEAVFRDVAEVDPAIEAAIFRKLDYRIVPMVMWCYLMNMMDRGMREPLTACHPCVPLRGALTVLIFPVNIGNARLFGLEKELGMTGDQFQLAVSVLFVTYCVSLWLYN